METPDPVTPLTTAELTFVKTLNADWTRERVLDQLKTNLQTAIRIELATIPIYLYTYYSLVRNNESGETISDAQLYANKAGGVIMSVAVEEMLHMSLSANILFAMGVAPQLYQQAPGVYPTGLPYHRPQGPKGPDGGTAVQIPLGKFGFEQLWHFLQIEYPEQWDAPPQDSDWDTIGPPLRRLDAGEPPRWRFPRALGRLHDRPRRFRICGVRHVRRRGRRGPAARRARHARRQAAPSAGLCPGSLRLSRSPDITMRCAAARRPARPRPRPATSPWCDATMSPAPSH
jgi:hypothetical protein